MKCTKSISDSGPCDQLPDGIDASVSFCRMKGCKWLKEDNSMKVINYKMEDQYHEALETVREFYSQQSGVKLTKVQALKRLLFESANMVQSKGHLWEKGGQSEFEA